MDECRPLALFAGTSATALGEMVAERLGKPLGPRRFRRFPDGEIHVQVEESIRGRDIYFIQSTSPPANENLAELLITIDALHRASAGRVTAIVPYYGYARQEKKSTGREPITAKLVADLITTAGADRVVSIDLHSPAIQGFFNIGMDHLTAVPILAEYLKSQTWENAAIVAPDTGRVKLADQYARALGLPLVILYKRRLGPQEVETAFVVGSIEGKRPIIVDDIISTGVTIERAIAALLQAGARAEVTIVATHGLLDDGAIQRLTQPAIRSVIISDTVFTEPEKKLALPRLVIVSVATLVAETIFRLNHNQSISELFTSYDANYAV